MRTEEPRTIALKDYRPPAYRISEVSLTFVLDPATTRVTSVMKLARDGAAEPLVLNGEHVQLVSVSLNGRPLDSCVVASVDPAWALPQAPGGNNTRSGRRHGRYTC